MQSLLIFSLLVVCATSSVIPSDGLGVVCQYEHSDIEYLFYSLKNPEEPIIVKNYYADDVNTTHFNASKETVLLLHGGGTNSSGPFVQKIRKAVVANKLDINLIAIEWAAFQDRNNDVDIYACGPMVGDIVGDFLGGMRKKFGLNYSKLALVGHSIGGGVIGSVGHSLKGQVKSIVSLEACTYKDYGKFVECIHTANANYTLMAHANYFPNGGGKQPHCPDPDPNWCNHYLVIDYFVESLTSKRFVGKQCENYAAFQAGKCENNKIGIMGGLNVDKTEGIFYLHTNANPPYAKGK